MTTLRPIFLAATLLAGALVGCSGAGLLGTDYNNIEYLCCDWGPAMTLPSPTNATAQFNDAEDEVYFLKQITSGRSKSVSIYLCKMKADGSGKSEIKELWHNPNHPIDTQAQSTWMDVNRKTHKIAFSITYAGSDITGLWTMKLDGSELKRIITPRNVDGRLQAIDCPSWTPDGQRIVWGESLRGSVTNWSRINICDADGMDPKRISDGPEDCQPHVSPDGQRIAFIHWIVKGDIHDSWLWLMDIDGINQRPLPNPSAQKEWSAQAHWGIYPAWSTDGNSVLLTGMTGMIVDTKTGKHLLLGQPETNGKRYTYGWPHWGRNGLVGFTVGGILVTDLKLKEAKFIGSSRLVECSGKAEADRW
jgi:Tol biopolymer transport system component